MASPSVTYTFSNGSSADASQVNTNFTDVINGITDGTKDINISALTCAGAVAMNGAVTLGNASGDAITVTGTMTVNTACSLDTAVTINDSGADVDFRVEGDTDANLLMCDASANLVGIGTATPTNGKLHVQHSSTGGSSDGNQIAVFERNGSASVTILCASNDQGGILFADTNDVNAGRITYTHNATAASETMVFTVNDTTTATLDGSGNVGIGATAGSGERLMVQGDGTGDTKIIRGENSSGGGVFGVRCNGKIDVSTSSWGTGGTAVGVSGEVLTTSPSARKYKENESSLTIDSSKIYDIEVKEFDYIASKGGAHDFGPIADDVNEVVPEIVWKEDGKPESIRESKMVWLLLEEMKKLKAEIEALKA